MNDLTTLPQNIINAAAAKDQWRDALNAAGYVQACKEKYAAGETHPCDRLNPKDNTPARIRKEVAEQLNS